MRNYRDIDTQLIEMGYGKGGPKKVDIQLKGAAAEELTQGDLCIVSGQAISKVGEMKSPETVSARNPLPSSYPWKQKVIKLKNGLFVKFRCSDSTSSAVSYSIFEEKNGLIYELASGGIDTFAYTSSYYYTDVLYFDDESNEDNHYFVSISFYDRFYRWVVTKLNLSTYTFEQLSMGPAYTDSYSPQILPMLCKLGPRTFGFQFVSNYEFQIAYFELEKVGLDSFDTVYYGKTYTLLSSGSLSSRWYGADYAEINGRHFSFFLWWNQSHSQAQKRVFELVSGTLTGKKNEAVGNSDMHYNCSHLGNGSFALSSYYGTSDYRIKITSYNADANDITYRTSPTMHTEPDLRIFAINEDYLLLQKVVNNYHKIVMIGVSDFSESNEVNLFTSSNPYHDVVDVIQARDNAFIAAYMYNSDKYTFFPFETDTLKIISSIYAKGYTQMIGIAKFTAVKDSSITIIEGGEASIPGITRGIYSMNYTGELIKEGIQGRYIGICLKDGKLFLTVSASSPDLSVMTSKSPIKIKIPDEYNFEVLSFIGMNVDGTLYKITTTTESNNAILKGIANNNNEICFRGECKGFVGLSPNRRYGFDYNSTDKIIPDGWNAGAFGLFAMSETTLLINDFIFEATNLPY